MKPPQPLDPMRTRATDNGPADAYRGAWVGADARARHTRQLAVIEAELDIGEPAVPRVTAAFLVLTLAVTFWQFATFGTSPDVAELARAGGSSVGAFVNGSWWKLLTANLLHANIFHVAMNAFLIYLMGRWLEHLVGRMLVLATVFWSALLASVGAVVVDAAAVTIGASGVAFGLVGCAVAADPRARTATGVMARQLAFVNLLATFFVPGISIGGHLGGLVAGLAVGALGWRRAAGDDPDAVGAPRVHTTRAIAACAVPLIALLAIGPSVLPDEASSLRSNVGASLLARQLSGAELTDGTTIKTATCQTTAWPARFICTTDAGVADVRFRSDDDQWSLRIDS